MSYFVFYKNMGDELFWLEDPFVLINKENVLKLYPSKNESLETNLNAVTRTIILLTCIGLFIIKHKPVKLIITSCISIFMIVLYYRHVKTNMKETFTIRNNTNEREKVNENENEHEHEHEHENYQDEEYMRKVKQDENKYQNEKGKVYQIPRKSNPYGNVLPTDITDNPQRKPAPPSYLKEVRKDIKKSVEQNLNSKLFRDLGDNMSLQQNQRNYYTMPNTDIPNNQKQFIDFCYGNTSKDKTVMYE